MNRRTVADLLLDGLIVVVLLLGLQWTLAVVWTPPLGDLIDTLSPGEPSTPWYFLPFYALDQLLPAGAGLLVIVALFLGLIVLPALDRSTGRSRWLSLLVGTAILIALVALGSYAAFGQPVQTPGRQLAPLPRDVPLEQTQCTVCHSELRSDYLENRHAEAGVTCVQCHGGNAQTLDEDAAHAANAGFRGTPSRADEPALCAGCHADPSRMRPYGLPTDQFAAYLTSRHGQQWQDGNTDVAVCSDCHTAHRVRPAFDYRSPVNPLNVPATCGQCHEDRERMAPYNLPTDQVEAFESGVHGRALLEAGNVKAPSCADCHGSHGTAPPGVEDVVDVCGTCHGRTRAYFNEGPHRTAMVEQGMAECTSCHRHHEIKSVELEATVGTLFETACTDCHASGSKAVTRGQTLKTLLQGASDALGRAEASLEQARAAGHNVAPFSSRLTEARAYLVQALPVQHSLDVNRVEDLTRRARSVAESVQGEAHGLLSAQRNRLVGLSLVWVFLALALVIALLYRRERRRERRQG